MVDIMSPPGFGTGPSNTAYLQALQNVVLAIQTASNYSGNIVTQLTNLVSTVRQNFWAPTATSTGSGTYAGNTQAVSYSNGPTAYATGQVFAFIVGAGLFNTITAATTVNINGLGALNVQLNGQTLSGGEFVPGTVIILAYDGTNLQIVGGAASSSTPHRNILINPSMEIDQINEGVAVVPNANQTIVDQWKGNYVSGGGMTATAQRNTVVVPLAQGASIKWLTTNGAAVGATGDSATIRQVIEANDITECGFGTAYARQLTLSFWVYCSTGPITLCASLRNGATNRSYVSNYTIQQATTWEQKFIIIPGDTTGTWTLTGTGEFGRLAFPIGASASLQAPPNTWSAGNLVSTSSMSNAIFTTTNAYLHISDVKLEISPFPTPFERRPFADELILCQRFYEKSYDLGVALGAVSIPARDGVITAQAVTAALQPVMPIRFKVTKRAIPTMSLWSPAAGTANNASYNGADLAGAAVVTVNTNGATVTANAVGGLVNATWSVAWAADCRL